MKENKKMKYKIDNDVLKNYVKAINSIKEPISQIKNQLNKSSKSVSKQLKSKKIFKH